MNTEQISENIFAYMDSILKCLLGESNLIFSKFLRVGKWKNKNIDHRGKETCV